MLSLRTGNLITPMILAGGSGTRLFPQSTPEMPKQFICRDKGTSLFQDSFIRLKDRAYFYAPFVIANKNHQSVIRSQISYNHTIWYEPIARNTGAAVIIGALHLLNKGRTTALICPSDHVIEQNDLFHLTISRAQAHLKDHEDHILFGILPDHPSPEFGYIQTDPFGNVTCFHEKPSKERAKALITSAPNTYWNSGICALHLPLLIEQMRIIAPDFLKKCQTAYENPTFENYTDIPSISFDKLFLEHCPSLFCLKAEFDWLDIGMQPELLQTIAA